MYTAFLDLLMKQCKEMSNNAEVMSALSYLNELDRSRCTTTELFGESYASACKASGGDCPFITVEAHGYGDRRVWCRTKQFANDDAHRCAHDRSKYCHVVSVRMGDGSANGGGISAAEVAISPSRSARQRRPILSQNGSVTRETVWRARWPIKA